MSMYLVTGAAGFIASKVCEFLLADGHTVVGIDNLNDYYDVRLKDYRLGQLLGDVRWMTNTSAKISAYANVGRLVATAPLGRKASMVSNFAVALESGEAMQGLAATAVVEPREQRVITPGSFVFEPIDIEDLVKLDRLFSEFQFDAVFNLAARAGVRYSMENPHVYMTTNAMGTLNLLECQRKYGVKKHVLASTSSLYAGCPMPFTEDQPVNTPLSPYAASKKAAEMMCYSYHKLYGIDVSVLRYFTVYGPAGRPDMAPYRFVHWIATGHPIKLFGDGTQTRDFTYVDDIARGTILATKAVGYEVVNIGGGNDPITINTMIAHLERSLGRKAAIDREPINPVDMSDTQAEIGKAGKLFGWKPRITPEEGFSRTVGWYSGCHEWLASVKV